MVLLVVLYDRSSNQRSISARSSDYTIHDFVHERFIPACMNCYAKMLYVKFSIPLVPRFALVLVIVCILLCVMSPAVICLNLGGGIVARYAIC